MKRGLTIYSLVSSEMLSSTKNKSVVTPLNLWIKLDLCLKDESLARLTKICGHSLGTTTRGVVKDPRK